MEHDKIQITNYIKFLLLFYEKMFLDGSVTLDRKMARSVSQCCPEDPRRLLHSSETRLRRRDENLSISKTHDTLRASTFNDGAFVHDSLADSPSKSFRTLHVLRLLAL